MKKAHYFVNLRKTPKIKQIEGLETTILTGLHGEKMMMVLNATLPGHKVPLHFHPHEQVGMVYSGKAILKIGDEERAKERRLLHSSQRAAQRHMHRRRAFYHA